MDGERRFDRTAFPLFALRLSSSKTSWNYYSERIQILFLAVKRQLLGGEIRCSEWQL